MKKNDYTMFLSFILFLVLVLFSILILSESETVTNKVSAIFSAFSLVIAIAVSMYSEYKNSKITKLNSLNIYYNELLRSYGELTFVFNSNVFKGSIALKSASGVVRSSKYLFENPDNFLFQESLITLTRISDLLNYTVSNFQHEEDYVSLSVNIFLSYNEIITNFELLKNSMENHEKQLTEKQKNVLKGYSVMLNEIKEKVSTLQLLILEHRKIPFFKIKSTSK